MITQYMDLQLPSVSEDHVPHSQPDVLFGTGKGSTYV
jgi:hypothetical protein